MSYAFLRAVAGAAAVFLSLPALALSVSLDTPLQQPVVGETFAANVIVGGVDSTTGLAFFDIDVAFDPGVLRLESVSLTDALGSLADGDAVDASLPPATDVVNLSIFSLPDDFSFQPATFSIGTLFFTALEAGATTLQFGFVGLENSLAEVLDHTATDADLTVVPVPAALWMFVPALGLLGLARRVRQDRVAA